MIAHLRVRHLFAMTHHRVLLSRQDRFVSDVRDAHEGIMIDGARLGRLGACIYKCSHIVGVRLGLLCHSTAHEDSSALEHLFLELFMLDHGLVRQLLRG